MISIIFIVLIALLVFWVVKDYDNEISCVIGCVITVGIFISVILIVCAICRIWDGAVATDKIKSYEQGKIRIEKEMGTMVNAYMDYEKDNVKRVSDKDAVSYVTVIPELKSSDLVKQEMALYADYDKRIMKLKEKQADAKFAKFLLYKIF
jgi:hypothetical protein